MLLPANRLIFQAIAGAVINVLIKPDRPVERRPRAAPSTFYQRHRLICRLLLRSPVDRKSPRRVTAQQLPHVMGGCKLSSIPERRQCQQNEHHDQDKKYFSHLGVAAVQFSGEPRDRLAPGICFFELVEIAGRVVLFIRADQALNNEFQRFFLFWIDL